MLRIVFAAVEAGDAGVLVAGGDDPELAELVEVGLLGGDEHRAAPDANAAHREGGGEAATVADPAGCDDRPGRDGVDHLREQRHRADPAGVTAGLVALGDDDVGVAIGDAQGVLDVTDERDDLAVGRVDLVDVGGRVAEAGGEHRHLHARDDVDLLLRREAGGADVGAGGLGVGQFEALADAVDGGALRVGQEVAGIVRTGAPAGAWRDVRGNEDVDAEGTIGEVLDTADLLFEAVGGEPGGAEHAESAGVGDRGDELRSGDAALSAADGWGPCRPARSGTRCRAGRTFRCAGWVDPWFSPPGVWCVGVRVRGIHCFARGAAGQLRPVIRTRVSWPRAGRRPMPSTPIEAHAVHSRRLLEHAAEMIAQGDRIQASEKIWGRRRPSTQRNRSGARLAQRQPR